MFWTGVAAMAEWLTRRASRTSGSSADDITDVSDTQETSSLQRESSEVSAELSLKEWSSLDSLITGSSFSEAMSDCVSADQQRREEQNAMALNRENSPVSDEYIRTGQWIQDNRGELASPQTASYWPNSNETATQATPMRAGCSRAPPDDSSPASKDTEAVLESMGYVGGMNYAKFRLESSRAKTAGKQKKARPPPHAACARGAGTRRYLLLS